MSSSHQTVVTIKNLIKKRQDIEYSNKKFIDAMNSLPELINERDSRTANNRNLLKRYRCHHRASTLNHLSLRNCIKLFVCVRASLGKLGQTGMKLVGVRRSCTVMDGETELGFLCIPKKQTGSSFYFGIKWGRKGRKWLTAKNFLYI